MSFHSAFESSKRQVFFCGQNVQTSRAGDQFFVAWVDTAWSDQVARTRAQTSAARVKRVVEEI